MKLTKKTTELIITREKELSTHIILVQAKGTSIVGNKLYCKKWKNYTTLKNTSRRIKEMLKAQGYKFTEGNDAPRGGVEGDFIKVSKVAMTFLIGIRNSKN